LDFKENSNIFLSPLRERIKVRGILNRF